MVVTGAGVVVVVVVGVVVGLGVVVVVVVVVVVEGVVGAGVTCRYSMIAVHSPDLSCITTGVGFR